MPALKVFGPLSVSLFLSLEERACRADEGGVADGAACEDGVVANSHVVADGSARRTSGQNHHVVLNKERDKWWCN